MIKQKKIDLNKLQVASVKMETINGGDSCAIVNILSFYSSIKRCGIDKRQVNLFVCKQESTGDTIYVFGECGSGKMIPFFKGVNIKKGDIRHKDLKEVIVSLPEDFIIPENAKYVFSDLFWLKN